MTAQITRTGREWGMTQRCIDLPAEHAVRLLCIRERFLFSDKGEIPNLSNKKRSVLDRIFKSYQDTPRGRSGET